MKLKDDPKLNIGHRLTPKDVVSFEGITWQYAWPLGIPWGKSYQAPVEKYPGSIKEVGIAIAYQRFFLKGAYGTVHALNTNQTYLDVSGNKIQDGYQLFMTYRRGYHLHFFKNPFFLEPSVAVKHWPVNNNVPDSFSVVETKGQITFCLNRDYISELNFY